MRITVVILLAIFGLILCLNLSVTTYISWQRLRADYDIRFMEIMGAESQRDFENCIKMCEGFPRIGGRPYPYDSWGEMFNLCDAKRKEAVLSIETMDELLALP